jgi:hypothetical protein
LENMTMTASTLMTRATRLLAGVAMTVLTAGCATEEQLLDLAPLEDEEVQSVSEAGEEITTRYPAGTVARTTTGLNLRSSPSTSARVLVVMPSGARVTLQDGVPQGGWYRVGFNGFNGWAFGTYLAVAAPAPGGTSPGGTSPGGTSPGGTSPGGTSPGGAPSSGVDFAGQLSRASSGEGFSYWWGHGRWLDSGPTASTRGSCSGSCPSCSHGGSYGADCSGYVAKIWRVPASNAPVSVDSHPYSTGSFLNTTGGGQWSRVSRSGLRPGDSLVYNNGSAGHIAWVRGGDAWGALDLYEARGCSYGIVRNTRSLGSTYVAIRRN